MIDLSVMDTSKIGLIEGPGLGSVEGESADLQPDRIQFNTQPNPFAGDTTTRFNLPAPAELSVTIRDLTGRLIRTLHRSALAEGPHTNVWDATDDAGHPVVTGVYQLQSADGLLLSHRRLMNVR